MQAECKLVPSSHSAQTALRVINHSRDLAETLTTAASSNYQLVMLPLETLN